MSDEGLGATEATPKENSWASAPGWTKMLTLLVLVPFFVGAFAELFFDKRYVPSRDWLESIEPFATIIGAIAALTSTFLVLRGLVNEDRRTRQIMTRVFAPLVLLMTMFLFYHLTTNLIRRGFPAMIAVAWGDAVEHPFLIGDVDDRGGKNCHRPIELRDMPVRTKLCEMPQEFRDQLHPGMPVIFIGKGTWMGLFVEDFRKP